MGSADLAFWHKFENRNKMGLMSAKVKSVKEHIMEMLNVAVRCTTFFLIYCT